MARSWCLDLVKCSADHVSIAEEKEQLVERPMGETCHEEIHAARHSIARTKSAAGDRLLDHLVGADEKRWQYRKAERLRGFQIDGQLKIQAAASADLHATCGDPAGHLNALRPIAGVRFACI